MTERLWKNDTLIVTAKTIEGEPPEDGLYEYIKVYMKNEKTDLYSAIAESRIGRYTLNDKEWNWLDKMAEVFETFVVCGE